MNRFWRWDVLAILILLILSLACIFLPYSKTVTNQNPNEHVFRMNIGTEPPTLDPTQMRDLVSHTVLNNTTHGLLLLDNQSGKLKPALSDHYTISPDGRTYTFHIRRTARWSDGKPVTANDFVFALKRGLSKNEGAPYAFFLFYIDNAKAYYDGTLKDFARVGIKSPNSQTLVFKLKEPIAFFNQLLPAPLFMPQRQDILEKYGDSASEAEHFFSTGPYQLTSWQHDDNIELTPNPYYYGSKPHFDRVRMMMIPEPNTSLIMYENNELDFVETASSLPNKEVRRLKNRPDYHFKTLHGIAYIGFNNQKPPINHPLVRQALGHAIDRSAFPKLFQSGEVPIKSWVSPGLIGYNKQIGLGFDPKKAQALLAKAGYPNGKGFPKIEFWVSASSPETVQSAEVAQAQWKKNLNIDVVIRRVEWKVFLKQLDQEPPAIFRLQWYIDYPDPDSYLTVFVSGSGNGNINWTNKQYDNWVTKGAKTLDRRRRQHYYDQAQQLLLEQDAAIVPLLVIPKSYLLKPGIEGVSVSPLNHVTIQ